MLYNLPDNIQFLTTAQLGLVLCDNLTLSQSSKTFTGQQYETETT